MGLYDRKPCTCGSGKQSVWILDARGIPVGRACIDCEEKLKAKFRPEIFSDPDYCRKSIFSDPNSWPEEPYGES